MEDRFNHADSAALMRGDAGRASALEPLQYDADFGTGGKMLINMGNRPTSWVSSIVPLRNSASRYLATYYETPRPGNPDAYLNNAGLVRFDSSGKVDSSFGSRGDGTVDVRFGPTHYSLLHQIIEAENGQLVVVGQHRSFADPQFLNIMVTRLNADGLVDKEFAKQGVLNVTTLVQRYVHYTGAVVLRDRHIILALTIAEEGPLRSFLVKLTPEGTLDSGFGVNGILELQRSAGKGTHLYGLKLLAASNQLLTYGYSGSGAGFIARLDTLGELDESFGQQGFVDIEPQELIHIRDVSPSSNENYLLVTGSRYNPETRNDESLLSKRLPSGKPYESFNQGKPVYLQFHPSSTYDFWNDARTLTDSNGRILTFGMGGTPPDTWSVAGRFDAQGQPDTTFVNGSSVGSPVNASFFYSGSYVVGKTSGTILCAGNADGFGAVLAIKV